MYRVHSNTCQDLVPNSYKPGQFTLLSIGLIRYSCGHISGLHEPIHVKFDVWGFFIMFYWNSHENAEKKNWWHHTSLLNYKQSSKWWLLLLQRDPILNFTSLLTTTDMHQRSQTSYTALCNGFISHGDQFGVFGFLRTTYTKTDTKSNRPQSLHVMRRFMCVLTSRSDCSRCSDIRSWRTAVILIWGKPKDPNLTPKPGSRWRRFWDLWCKSVLRTQLTWQ